MHCYIDEERYEIKEDADFSNIDLWNALLDTLKECNQIMEATNGLVQDNLVIAYNKKESIISKEEYSNNTNSMIRANQECIKFIRSKL